MVNMLVKDGLMNFYQKSHYDKHENNKNMSQ
jgi:hypothetical protein